MKRIIYIILKIALVCIFLIISSYFLTIFIKNGCKINDDCYLCFKYKGNQSKAFSTKKFMLIKKGLYIEKVRSIIGYPYFINTQNYYEFGDTNKLHLVYVDDWKNNNYIVSLNKDSIVVYTEIQEAD